MINHQMPDPRKILSVENRINMTSTRDSLSTEKIYEKTSSRACDSFDQMFQVLLVDITSPALQLNIDQSYSGSLQMESSQTERQVGQEKNKYETGGPDSTLYQTHVFDENFPGQDISYQVYAINNGQVASEQDEVVLKKSQYVQFTQALERPYTEISLSDQIDSFRVTVSIQSTFVDAQIYARTIKPQLSVLRDANNANFHKEQYVISTPNEAAKKLDVRVRCPNPSGNLTATYLQWPHNYPISSAKTWKIKNNFNVDRDARSMYSTVDQSND